MSKWVRSEDGMWYIGTQMDGCGVFPSGVMWSGTVCLDDRLEGLREYNTAEEAMKAAETRWLEKRKELGYPEETPTTVA